MLTFIYILIFAFLSTFWLICFLSGYKSKGNTLSIYGYTILLLILFVFLFFILTTDPYAQPSVITTIMTHSTFFLFTTSILMILAGFFISLYELSKKNWVSLFPIILFIQIIVWIIFKL